MQTSVKKSSGTIGENGVNGATTTALMYACSQGDLPTVQKLIHQQPWLISQTDRSARSALHYCCWSPLRKTSAACADVLLMAAPHLLAGRDKDGFAALHLAVVAGDVHLLQFLIAQGADVNVVDNEGHSVVHWATVSGELSTLQIVLSSGANAEIADQHGGYPLHYAAQMCGSSESTETSLSILQLLLSSTSPHVTDAAGRTPLLWAASGGSAAAVLALFRAGANVSAADTDGLTALHCAASRGNSDVIETLLSLCGAQVDVIDENGCTPLHYSVALGHADATTLLLSHGAQLNTRDRRGRSPAHCGCTRGQLATVKQLHSAGADLWLRNARGDLPLHEAAASGRRELLEWLLTLRPSQVNARNNDGRSSLHLAAAKNYVDLCKVLLDAGANPNPLLRTSRGEFLTPLDCALRRGFRSTAKFLQLHGGLPASRLRLSDTSSPNKLMQRETSSKQSTRQQQREVTTDSDEESRVRKKSNKKKKSTQKQVSEKAFECVVTSDENEPTETINKTSKKKKNDKATNELTIISDKNTDKIAQSEISSENESVRNKKTANSTKSKKQISVKNSEKALQSDVSSDENESIDIRKKSNKLIKSEESEEVNISDKKISKKLMSSKISSDENENELSKIKKKKKSTEIVQKKIKEKATECHVNSEDEAQSSDAKSKTKKSAKKMSHATDKIDNNLQNEVNFNEIKSESSEIKKKINKKQNLANISHDKKKSEETINDISATKISISENNIDENNINKNNLDNKQSKDFFENSTENEREKVNKEIIKNEELSNAKQLIEIQTKEMEVKNTDEKSKKKLQKTKSIQQYQDVEETNEEFQKVSSQENLNSKEKDTEIINDDNKSTEEKITNLSSTKEENVEEESKDEQLDEKMSIKSKLSDEIPAETIIVEATVHQTKDSEEKETKEILTQNGEIKAIETIDEHTKVQEMNEENVSTKVENVETIDEIIITNIGETNVEKPNETTIQTIDEVSLNKNRERKAEETEVKENNLNISEKKDTVKTKEESTNVQVKEKDIGKQINKNEDSVTNVKEKMIQEGTVEGNLNKSEEAVEKHQTSGEEKVELEERKKNELNIDLSLKKFESENQEESKRRKVRQESSSSFESSSSDSEHKSFKLLNDDVAFKVLRSPRRVKKSKRRVIRKDSLTSSPEMLEQTQKNRSKSVPRDERTIVLPYLTERRSASNLSAPNLLFDDKIDGKKRRAKSSKSAGSGYEIDSGFEPSPRTRIPKPNRRHKPMSSRSPNMTSVTQQIQSNIRRYQMERRIFQHLLDLKRLQIRSGQSNEHVLVKRAIDHFNNSAAATVGAGRYSNPTFTYKSFERFLYRSLKMLQHKNDENGQDEEDPLTCTKSTHRCLHATHAYTGIPCAAYLPKMNHHTLPKIGYKPFLPHIHQQQKAKTVTLELCHGQDKQVISLPADKLDQNKRYYVTFTVKGQDKEGIGLREHRHAKSV